MLTTLTRFQNELRTYPSGDVDDQEMIDIIIEISYELKERCNREFYYKYNEVEMLSAFASPYLRVKRHTPIDVTQTISVVFDSAAFDPSIYTVPNPNLGIIYNRTGWYWTAPLLPNVQQDPFPGYENPLYQVTYSGGWVTPQQAADNPSDPILAVRTLPYDIERACLDACVAVYRMRGKNPLMKSEGLMSYRYAFKDDMLIPSVERMVARRRRTGVSS